MAKDAGGKAGESRNLGWACSCGARFPENGMRTAWGQWSAHQRDNKTDDHVPVGLVDLDTDEVVVPFQSHYPQTLKAAEEKGYVLSKKEAEKAKGVEDGKKKAAAGPPKSLEGVVPLQRVALSPSVYAYKGMTQPILAHADGRPYGWDEAEMAEWFEGMIELATKVILHRYLAQILGVSEERARRMASSGVVEQLIAVARGTDADQLREMMLRWGIAPAEIEHAFGSAS